MKIKNFKINYPLFIGLVLAATLVSCHNDNIRRENEKREEVKRYFDNIPKVEMSDTFNTTNTYLEVENKEVIFQKTK